MHTTETYTNWKTGSVSHWETYMSSAISKSLGNIQVCAISGKKLKICWSQFEYSIILAFLCFNLQRIISVFFPLDSFLGQEAFWYAQFYAATDFLLFLKSYRYILNMHALACLVPDVFGTNFVVWAWDSWGIPHFFQKLAIFLYHLLCHGHSQEVSNFSTVQKMMLPKVVHFSTDK